MISKRLYDIWGIPAIVGFTGICARSNTCFEVFNGTRRARLLSSVFHRYSILAGTATFISTSSILSSTSRMSESPYDFTFTYFRDNVDSGNYAQDTTPGILSRQESDDLDFAAQPSQSSYASLPTIHSPRRPTRSNYSSLGGALGTTPNPPPNYIQGIIANHAPVQTIPHPSIYTPIDPLTAPMPFNSMPNYVDNGAYPLLPDATAPPPFDLGFMPIPPPNYIEGAQASHAPVQANPQPFMHAPDYTPAAFNFPLDYDDNGAYLLPTDATSPLSLDYHHAPADSGSRPLPPSPLRPIEKGRKKGKGKTRSQARGSARSRDKGKRKASEVETRTSSIDDSPQKRQRIETPEERLKDHRDRLIETHVKDGILSEDGFREVNELFIIEMETSRTNNKPKKCLVCLVKYSPTKPTDTGSFTTSARLHADSKRHRKAVHLYLSTTDAPEAAVSYTCELCDYRSGRKDTFQSHRASQKCKKKQDKQVALEARPAISPTIEHSNLVPPPLQQYNASQESPLAPVDSYPAIEASGSRLPSLSPGLSSLSPISSGLQTPEFVFTDPSSALSSMPRQPAKARRLVQAGSTCSELQDFGNIKV
ncbi:hypothetical protein BC629DRAFT_689917 [Irpex lacteus]|nr:hypothetical protein BC629DRAFT_689917 [Irpex lacteus]